MFKERIKDLLKNTDHKRILLYGLEGLGKTYFANSLFEDIHGGYIIINFRSDDISNLINNLNEGMDITEALVNAYSLSEVLHSVTFILDEFLETDHIKGLTEKKKSYKYKDLKIIYITSEQAWSKKHSALFDACICANKVSFTDFLRQSGDSFYAGVVEAHMKEKKNMPSLIHNELTDMYYQYISTGGYPRAVYESAKEDTEVFPEDLAAERYKGLIGNICIKEQNSTSAQNKIQIINTIPECSKNSKFVISKTGRRHIDKRQLEKDIEDLIEDDVIIKIPRLGSTSYSLALTDDAIYRYLLIKNKYNLQLSEEKIKELVIENHIRNILAEKEIKTFSWTGKNRFKINVLIESDGKFCPVKVICNRSKRKINYFEFLKEYGKMTSVIFQFTESSFSDSKDIIYMPIYGCEYLENFIPQL